MAPFLIGIDNGGTVTKAAVYTVDGRELAVSSRKTVMIMPQPGHTERDMEELWKANVSVIKEVLAKSGIDPKEVAGVAVTGHGNGLYLVDAAGKPVGNGIVSTDTRAKHLVEQWYQDGTAERVLPKTMQSIWTGQPVALLGWLQANRREALERARWILMCKDFIRYRLTGEAYAEVTDISGTNLFNIKDVSYDDELLAEFGLQGIADKLPPVKYSADICGYVTEQAAKETGLAVGTPVAGGLFDIDASAIASGVTDEDKLCVVAGTWSINEYITKEPVVDKALFMTSIYCIPGYWLTLEGSPTSASNLEWFTNEFFSQEHDAALKQGITVYELCNQMVASTKPEDSHIVFFPFLFGSNVDANAKACFIGLNGWHTKAHMVRALYEGVVFGHRQHIDKLLVHRSRPKAVRLAGGATRSEEWMQMFADVLQLPVEVVEGTEQGTLGASICAGVATKHFDSFSQAAESMVKVSKMYTPQEQHRDIYEQKYQAYLEVLEALQPLWKKLS
ncbi:FGGY-family carbohydrate kinase [Brevibacillus parabrevis]|uniref:FGGY-family carbohydrate kinase n=1 Tax=Brevibacillus parabrevis TaxID=54914 RepID=UPI002380AC82|nr:FGGY-family carbohydrate kinase [Brevibacillus parabrevis]WDV97492.1 carbohydrate kinase [Brevibacillus parabrevis]